jgi:phosphopantothenoylcysteine decarboxylase / phosphopantothenate---cysteine ligase
MMDQKRVLLIIGGGIAAYKAPELVRQLKAQGLATRCLLTAAAEQFVSPLSLASVSGDKVYENLFDLTDEAEMGHIQLSRDADMILVAPATADLIAKMAQGLANDLASTALLATDKPVMIAPAMNVRMWEHAATQRNLAQLAEDGIGIIGPDEGDMACGEFGLGRMSQPAEIAQAAKAMLAQTPARDTPLTAAKPLAGRKILVTAGPTYEPIDPVRYIANRSSGKQGYALAEALAALGANVHLVSGPTALNDPKNVTTKRVETARQMLDACTACLPVDAAIMAAAVADWRPAEAQEAKIKKTKSGLDDLKLVENPDILATLSGHASQRPQLVVGFAAETNDIENYAREKLARKKCDWIVANDVSQNSGIAGGVMGGDDNQVHILSATQTLQWETMSKTAVAAKLAAHIADYFAVTKEHE